MTQDVFITAGARTPMGGLQGDLSSLTAVELGQVAIEAALERSAIAGADIDEVNYGVRTTQRASARTRATSRH